VEERGRELGSLEVVEVKVEREEVGEGLMGEGSKVQAEVQIARSE